MEEKTLPKYKIFYSRFKRKLLSKHLNLVRFSLFTLLILAILGSSSLVRNSLKNSFLGNLVHSGYNFLFIPEDALEKYQERTNVLILGKAGEGSDSPELTDTIIVASFNSTEQRVDLISIPRDIWSDDINLKINEAYKIGNEREKGGGLKLAKSLSEKVVGIPIHYSVTFDLSGLKNIINILGGIEVDVQNSFTDEKFPIAGKENDECGGDIDYKCRYETVSFEKGIQTMEGENALKFARSRHSTDLTEGTDFARAARQQLIISAISSKLLSSSTLTSPNKLISIYKLAREKTETDLTDPQAAVLARIFAQSKDNISRNIIPEELLENPPLIEKFNYLYVFTAAEENWQTVHSWVQQVLE